MEPQYYAEQVIGHPESFSEKMIRCLGSSIFVALLEDLQGNFWNTLGT